MRFLAAILFLSFYIYSPVLAQTPGWVSSYGSTTPYHTSGYLTGFGMAAFANGTEIDDALQQAEADSRQNLVQKVRVQVESEATSIIEEADDEFSSQFISATRTTANLELFGLQSENYVDDSGSNVYVLSHISLDAVRDQFLEKLDRQREEFNRLVETAGRNYESGTFETALEQYLTARSRYSDLIETWSLLQSVERSMVFGQAGKWHPEQVRETAREVDNRIEQIMNRPVHSLDDAAWILANTMGTASEESITVNISAITYRDSGISSEFANYLRNLMERQLNNRTSWVIQGIGQEYNRNPSHILTGTFWDREDEVHVIINLRDINSGQILAATETTIPKPVINEAGLALLPDNYEEAIANQKALQSGESNSRGLTLSAWTSKGENNLVFTEGDIIEVSLQVNLPSYIRILYHLKDGRRVLLMDSHYINPRDVNRPYTLPYRFECVPPFGVESMQVIAQNEPFERVQTREVDGMPILAEDLETFLSNTRGFKMVKEEAQQAEQILTITTMPKQE